MSATLEDHSGVSAGWDAMGFTCSSLVPPAIALAAHFSVQVSFSMPHSNASSNARSMHGPGEPLGVEMPAFSCVRIFSSFHHVVIMHIHNVVRTVLSKMDIG